MDSNLVTPPDIVENVLHSVLLIDPEQYDVDAVIKFCQHCDTAFNVYVYTPNMKNTEWLKQAVDASDTLIINTRSNNNQEMCLLERSYYYGPKLYLENPRKIDDPLHYFVLHINK
jgi:hypothetical protein